jgi:hypothetical protein
LQSGGGGFRCDEHLSDLAERQTVSAWKLLPQITESYIMSSSARELPLLEAGSLPANKFRTITEYEDAYS